LTAARLDENCVPDTGLTTEIARNESGKEGKGFEQGEFLGRQFNSLSRNK
jgi:hypothetical protein